MTRDDVIKSLTVVGPFLASTFAVTYDVGFFYGSDIGFFTFFSFTEHLVFALQAAPFAIPTAGAVAGWLFGSWLGYQQGVEIAAKFVEADADERKAILDRLENRHKTFLKTRPFIIGCMIVAGVFNLSNHNYTAALTSWLTAAAIQFFPTVVDLKAKPSLQLTTGAAVVLSSLLLAFLFGYDRAQTLVTSTAATQTIYIEDKSIPARLIRSGDRGVLFYSIEGKKIRFLRWDAIEQIESA